MDNDEIRAAREALTAGDFELARHHLNQARVQGVDQAYVRRLVKDIDAAEAGSVTSHGRKLTFALFVAVLGYAVLSIQQPTGWTPLVWGVLAFGLIPLFSGLLAGKNLFSETGRVSKASRFLRGFFVVAISMGIYTIVNMSMARGQIQSAQKSLDLAIYLVVGVAFGVIAGIVGGLSAATIGARGAQ